MEVGGIVQEWMEGVWQSEGRGEWGKGGGKKWVKKNESYLPSNKASIISQAQTRTQHDSYFLN